jgi:hypothetical protein
LRYCRDHEISLDKEEVEALAHTEEMHLYLEAMALGKVEVDCSFLTSRIQEPWAQAGSEIYSAIRKGRCTSSIAPLRQLLSGNMITVRINAAIALARLNDLSVIPILEREYQRLEKGGFLEFNSRFEEIGRIIKKQS